MISKMGPTQASFSFVFFFPKCNTVERQIKSKIDNFLPVKGFELRISTNGNDRSANCAIELSYKTKTAINKQLSLGMSLPAKA